MTSAPLVRCLRLSLVGVVAAALGASAAVPSLSSAEEASEQASTDSGRVGVILELDVAPAAQAFRAASARGPRAAGSASAEQTRLVRRLQMSVAASAASLGAQEVFRVSAVYAGIAVRAPAERLAALAAIPGVAGVHPLISFEPANWTSVPLMGAPDVWESAGLTGSGVTIGIIDTGIDYTHADFGGPGTPEAYAAALAAKDRGEPPQYPDPAKVAGGYDFAGNDYNVRNPAEATPQPDDNPLDCQGHGTHVAGTAGGYGVSADGTTYRGPWDVDVPFSQLGIAPGVAPEATLYSLKVFGCKGSSDLVVEALDWAMDPNGDGDLSDHLDVVNMSLGSPFGFEDDPTTVATQNAVLAGMSVVAAAGNDSPQYLSSGSPSVAPAAISVAASRNTGLVVDAMRLEFSWSDDSATSDDTVVGRMSGYFAVSARPDVTAEMTRIGSWDEQPGPENNANACLPLSPEQSALVAGRALAVPWPSPSPCSPSRAVRNATSAGAAALIFATSLEAPGDYPPARDLPAFSVTAATTQALKSALDAGAAVTVTLGSFGMDAGRYVYPASSGRSSQVAAFSSMGGPLRGTVKPDVSAPGSTIFSAAVGEGSGGRGLGGTSMAAPHVAGQAALVIQAHPDWTALEVKSAIVSTAIHDLRVHSQGIGPRIGPMLVGAGRVDVPLSLDADIAISLPAHPGSSSVSFGILDAREPLTRSQTVRVNDRRESGSARTFSLSLDTVNPLPGTSFSVSPPTLRLRPGESGDVTVTMRVVPRRLIHRADPALTLVPEWTSWMREFLAPASAILTLEASGSTGYRVAVAAAPRPASALSSVGPVAVTGSRERLRGALVLQGEGVSTRAALRYERVRSRVSAVQLLGTSPRLPVCGMPGCLSYSEMAGSDLRYAGASSDALLSDGDPLAVDDSAMAYFGIATWGNWQTAYSRASFTVHLDTNRDGVADALVTSAGPGQSQIMTSVLTSLRSGDDTRQKISESLLNNVDGRRDTAKIHGNVVVIPVRLAALAHPGTFTSKVTAGPFISAADARIDFWVTSAWQMSAGITQVDSVGSAEQPLTIDLLNPAVTAFGTGERPMPALAMPGTQLDVSILRDALLSEPRLLLLHHLNTPARRAEIVSVVEG